MEKNEKKNTILKAPNLFGAETWRWQMRRTQLIAELSACSLRIKYKRSAILPAANRRPAFNSLARTARVWRNLFGYKWGTNAHYWMPRRHITNTHMTQLFYFILWNDNWPTNNNLCVFVCRVLFYSVSNEKSPAQRHRIQQHMWSTNTVHMNSLCSSEMR